MGDTARFANIKLVIGQDIEGTMEQRLILAEDVKKVIEYAERTGNKLVNPDTGHFAAHLLPETVTYWVEYAPVEEGFRVFNAYSHRMQIVGEVQG